jgi:hypothetical protein
LEMPALSLTSWMVNVFIGVAILTSPKKFHHGDTENTEETF